MYATRSCHPNAKIFYRPIDAALRWCNLMAFEREILEAGRHCTTMLKIASHSGHVCMQIPKKFWMGFNMENSPTVASACQSQLEHPLTATK